jgi:parallel beta-helix repeat protein
MFDLYSSRVEEGEMNKKIVVPIFAFVLLLSIVTNTQFAALVGAEASEETLGIYNFIESLPPESVVILSFDYGPSTKMENDPQAKACLFHCKKLGLQVIGVAFWPTGAPTGEYIFTQVYGENFQDLPEYGTQFVYIGYIPGGAVGMRTFGDNTWLAISIDHFGNSFSDLPLMDEVRSAEDFDLWMEIMSGTPGVDEVLMYVQTPHGGPEDMPVGVACTEVCYPGLKPYYDLGYLVGILRGLQGTFEYEWLLMINYGAGGETGVWVKYGEMTSVWNSNDPKAKPPDFLNIEWINNTVQTVYRKNITFQFIAHYKNDTEITGKACIHLYTGEGNGTFWFVSAGLLPGESIYASPEWIDWKINETISKTYAGVTRDTNHLTMTKSQIIPSNPPQNVTVSVDYYWNKVTGVLTEYQELFLNQTGGYTTSWDLSYRIVDTNLWTTIDVPADYSTIQEAIDAAKPGDTIHVEEGIYLEHVIIHKSLMLVGENSRTTIIDGTGDGTVITISARNVEISGFTVQNGRDGIVVKGYFRGSIIQGNTISNNTSSGIFIHYGNDNVIQGNTVSNNTYSGISVWYGNNSIIKENIMVSNGLPNEWGYGVELRESHNNFVYNNTIMNNWYGIRLILCSANTLSYNNMTDNHFNFGVSIWSSSLAHFIHGIDTSNTVNGKPINYLINQHKITIDPTTFSNVGYLGIVNSTNIVVKNLNTAKIGEGVLFAWTNNSTIENIQTSNNHYGLALVFSNSNMVSENTVESIYHTGIRAFSCNNNTVVANRIINSGLGLVAHTLNSSTISRNTISNSVHGVSLTLSFKNRIDRNTVKNSSDFGIGLSLSSYNHIFHNNFISNTNQVLSYDSINAWDDDYPSGGNYWSDYAGTDLYSGPYQNEIGSDGIGDTPYFIKENNQDNYPLMDPWIPAPQVITVTVDINPKTLNLRSRGKWINCYIELPQGYKAKDVDVSTIMLNGTITAEIMSKGRGAPHLMVKFDRQAVTDLILTNYQSTYKFGTETLIITGYLNDGTLFLGNDSVRIIYSISRGTGKGFLVPI